MAPIKVGDKLPRGVLSLVNKDGNLKPVSLRSLAAHRKIILLGGGSNVVMAPTACDTHIKGFAEKSDDFKAKGIDQIIVIYDNGPFVKLRAEEYPNIKVVYDGDGRYSRHALGMEESATWDMWRFSLICDNLRVQFAHIDEGWNCEASRADEILRLL